jgi:hypothetical protein
LASKPRISEVKATKFDPVHSYARLRLRLKDAFGTSKPVPCFLEPPFGGHRAAQHRAGDGDSRLLVLVIRSASSIACLPPCVRY